MGFLRLAARRALPAAGAAGLAGWAAITTANDDWDDYTHHPLLRTSRTNATAAGGNADPTKKERIVILGSGWAALSALSKSAAPDKDIVVVSPRPHFLYTPLLAGSAVGTITLRSACEPLRALVERAAGRASSATFVRADARSIAVESKTVMATTGGGSASDELQLSYDKLVVAVGSQPNTFGIPGVQQHALFLKEAADSSKLHARLLSHLERAAALLRHGRAADESEIDRLLKIVVVGGGPTGVELSAELADFARNDAAARYGQDLADRIQIVLVEAMPTILGPFDPVLQNVALDHLRSRGVDVRTGVAVTRVDKTKTTFAPSTPFSAPPDVKAAALAQATTEDTGCVVWAAGIGARPLVKKLAQTLGQSDLRGLQVDSCLRVKGVPDGSVYALGDCALSGNPPTAQVAAQQGKHVGRALRDGAYDRPFAYRHAGSLCCLGSGNGIAQLVTGSAGSSSLGGGSSNFDIWALIGAEPLGPDGDQRALRGTPAFVLWRSLYWTRLLSTSSRLSLAADWTRAQYSGRDVVEPVLQRTPTVRRPVETFGTNLQRNPTVRVVKEKVEDVSQKKRFWMR